MENKLSSKPNYINLPAETILNDRYIIKYKLADESNFSILYLAYDKKKRRRVVIKEFFPSKFVLRGLDGEKVIIKNKRNKSLLKKRKKCFMKEAKIINKFDDENIVKCYDVFKENNTSYIVLKYYKGKNLKEYLDEKEIGIIDFLGNIFLPLINIVKRIHDKFYIHGDIKPDNIIVMNKKLVLLDFGSAIKYTRKKDHCLFVSPGYSPLEFYSSKTQKGPYSDLYSLSALLYYYFATFVPVDARKRIIEDNLKDLRTINYKVSRFLNKLIKKNLSLDYRDRDKNILIYRLKVLSYYYSLKSKKFLSMLYRRGKNSETRK